VRFATSAEAVWTRNFRDLGGAVARMCTVAGGGRITTQIVDEEISRLRTLWRAGPSPSNDSPLADLLSSEALDGLDLFDPLQLEAVVRAARGCRTLSEAGRLLFAQSRAKKAIPNDADRVRKCLARFGLSWDRLASRL
jgi:transcriptional regulatory protein RtcR